MLSKAMIFREMKSESGFSFAMASQPLKSKNKGIYFSTHLGAGDADLGLGGEAGLHKDEIEKII